MLRAICWLFGHRNVVEDEPAIIPLPGWTTHTSTCARCGESDTYSVGPFGAVILEGRHAGE